MINVPELIGDSWINSKPLKKDDLKGKVVLYDFWTYSCVNCQRTIPYLKEWWAKYKDKNFIMVGIHTPEFEFEKDLKNVEQACIDNGITWPVVLDNEYANWNNFANHYWPAKYLANAAGKIVYTHFGEGSYTETEIEIQKLLGEMGTEINSLVSDTEHAHGSVCFRPTPELYLGYSRGRLTNQGGYAEEKIFEYKYPQIIPPNEVGLTGKFIATKEYLESEEIGAKILLNFSATEVNLVLHPVDASAKIKVELNDKDIPDNLRGFSVEENSEVIITKPTLYNFIKSKKLVEGIISITATQGNFRGYAFTFSGCEQV